MQFTFELDIEGIVAQATAPEKIQPLLDKAITEALKSAISDATGYNSQFRKRLTEQLQTALPHGLGISELAKFQQIANDLISKAAHDTNAETLRIALKGVLDLIGCEAPASIKLSELLEMAREDFNKENGEAFYAYMEPSGTTDGYYHLYFDSDPSPGPSPYGIRATSERDSRKYSAAFSMAVNPEGDVYSMKLEGKDLTPSSRPTVISHFDSLMLCLYTGRTRIEADLDADGVEHAAAEKYD